MTRIILLTALILAAPSVAMPPASAERAGYSTTL